MVSNFESFLIRLQPPHLIYLVSFWDIKSVIRATTASLIVKGAMDFYSRTVWDIDIFFKKWFIRPLIFRLVMRECRAFVSGSQAVQFFGRTRYEGSDLDIYCRGSSASAMIDWLILQGYKLDGSMPIYNRQDEEYDTDNEDDTSSMSIKSTRSSNLREDGILNVYTLNRFVGSQNGLTDHFKIQVMAIWMDPVEHVLFHFHSSK